MAPLYNQGISRAKTSSNLRSRDYPTTVSGNLPYASNPSRRGYPSTSTYGAQPSLTALAERSANYSGAGGSTGGSTGGSSGSRKKSTSSAKTASASTGTTTTADTYDTAAYDNTPSFDAAAAYRNLLDAYRSQQSSYEDYLNQMREAAQEAYDRSSSALNSAYDAHLSALSGNLDSQKQSLLDAYNRSKTGLNKDAESSLKQAYINNKLQGRNLRQRLSAMGLTGGATETSLVNMANTYGNQRNDINKTLNNNLYNLEGNYNNNLADALRAYNSAVANAQLQKAQQAIDLENALASNKMSALSNYQNMMSNYNNGYLDLLRNAIANGVDLSGSSGGDLLLY